MTRDTTRRAVLRAASVGALGGGLAATGTVGGTRPGAGSAAAAPVDVSTVADLQAIRDDLAGDYVLVDDVDASGFDFEPVGGADDPFTGTLDGDGHSISGLTIDRSGGRYVGLFGVLGSRDAETGGVVENVALEGVDVVGGVSVGGLAGSAVGTLSDVSVGGAVGGEERVGGVAGGNGGCVSGVRATCSVTGESVVGGLVGRNLGSVSESSAVGSVAGAVDVGGLVGTVQEGSVSQSSASGDVTGQGRLSNGIGGLVGTLGGRVSGSTAEGSVSGNEHVGSLVGYSTGVALTSTAAGSGDLVGTNQGAVVTGEHPSLGGSPRVSWWFQTYTGDRVSASPTVVDGTVYAGTFPGLGGCDPNVYAVDAATGEEAWAVDTEARGTRTAGSHRRLSYVRTSSANVVDGIAYVKVPDRGLVLAIDAASSEERWRARMEWEGHAGSPTRYGDTLFAKDGEWLYWFDAETGAEKRRRAIEDPGAATTVADGTVFAYDRNDGLRAVDVRSGDTVWAFDGLETPIRHSAPAVAAGTVYAAGREGILHAVDAATGDPKWNVELAADGTTDPPRTTPTVAGGTVFLGTRSGRVYAVDAATGGIEWIHLTTAVNSVHSSPTVVGSTVFFGSDDEHLYAVDVGSGEEQWTFETRGAVRSAPVVVDGVVYFGTTNGFVYALDAGVDGSSEDSRVAQGTLGHHGAWAQQDDVPRGTAGPGATPPPATEDGQRTGTTEDGHGAGATTTADGAGATSDRPTDTPGDDSDTPARGDGTATGPGTTGDGTVQVPGPGIVGALGSVLGAGTILARRARGDDSGDDHD